MADELAYITMSLPPDLKEKVEECAAAEDRSVSAFIRRALMEKIAKIEAEKKAQNWLAKQPA